MDIITQCNLNNIYSGNILNFTKNNNLFSSNIKGFLNFYMLQKYIRYVIIEYKVANYNNTYEELK